MKLVPPPPGRVVTVETRNGTRVTGKAGRAAGNVWTIGGQTIRATARTRWTPAPLTRAA